SSREHVRHQALVARGVDEADRPQELGRLSADGTGRARRVGRGNRGAMTLVECSVCVSDLDRDSSSQLLAVCGCPDAGDSLNNRGVVSDDTPSPRDEVRVPGYAEVEDEVVVNPGLYRLDPIEVEGTLGQTGKLLEESPALVNVILGDSLQDDSDGIQCLRIP